MEITSTGTVSSAAGAAAAGQPGALAADFDSFLRLLTAQLQNQDPLAPMDADKFTSQLVQFASVEQALATNKKLDGLNEVVGTAARTAALGYLGAEVEVDGAFIRPQAGRSGFAYELAREAQDVTVKIHGPDGKLVLQESGGLAKGTNRFTWDGRLADGRPAADGSYRVAVTAKDAQGRAVPVTMRTIAAVEGVDLAGTSPALRVEGATLPLDAVRTVRRPTL
jgi:flagellar basal-body rod modification protein FlgD